MSQAPAGYRVYVEEVSRAFLAGAVVLPLGAALLALATRDFAAVNLVHVVAGAAWAGATLYLAGATDARLLVRYLRNEGDDLRPWNPPSRDYQTLQRLIHRRATVVRARTAIQQSLREIPTLKTTLQATLRQLDRTLAIHPTAAEELVTLR